MSKSLLDLIETELHTQLAEAKRERLRLEVRIAMLEERQTIIDGIKDRAAEREGANDA